MKKHLQKGLIFFSKRKRANKESPYISVKELILTPSDLSSIIANYNCWS